MFDGYQNKLLNVFGAPEGSVLGPQMFFLYTSKLFSMLENKFFGYADDSTLMLCHRLVPEEISAQKRGITSKSLQVFHDWSLLLRYCLRFVLPVMECCLAVFC